MVGAVPATGGQQLKSSRSEPWLIPLTRDCIGLLATLSLLLLTALVVLTAQIR